jgi:hypothetical protein
LHVPGFASADAATEALKARASAVLKREEAAAVRSTFTIFLWRIPFIRVSGSCQCHQCPIACFGSRRVDS